MLFLVQKWCRNGAIFGVAFFTVHVSIVMDGTF